MEYGPATPVPQSRLVENPIARPAISPQGTTQARHIAASLDLVLAMFLSVVPAQQIDEHHLPLQLTVAIATFLGYYFLLELLFGRTAGKMLTGLKVVDFNGGRCSFGQTFVRTLLRLLEVNPLLLGGLPAAVQIIWSRNKQRLGDRLAGTVVVYQ